ncbi:MAG: TetR family transcriptional regulator [Nocardiopsis sp. BM-2018]|uniref:AcrR family transcriptional regulator n=1 Tax=Nocardiopsis metallicus TaxID=179819 RepID=A0A840WJL9_9ACTN|nr:TetR family transcriptional regulator [Nocardiopsis metallicus]MBB5493181.1 AcrR family transcriptional regulator [Nocardiopsis metallicus]QRN80943.1 MAG: TetR family transcriptional regulator [Nocardiopsis sp. BM-2018]
MSTTSPERVGLRERKKTELRRTLIESGLRLFHEKGYEATTTEEIAACAGVSQRTFFRYFASKEDVVLDAVEGVDEVLCAALRDRPCDEHPFRALRNAMRDHWAILERENLHLHGSAGNFIARSPELFEANMRYCHRRQAKLAEVIGERTGVDPAVDPRPALVATVFFAALNNGFQAWAASGCTDDTDGLLRAFLEQLDLVPEAVCETWSADGSGDQT